MNQHVETPLNPEDVGAGPEAEKDPGRPADTADVGALPPDEDPAPEAWEAIEQLFALAPHLRSGRANVMGDTRVSGDVVAGDKRVDVYLRENSMPRLHTVGPLPTAELDYLAETFAPNRRYDELCSELTARRVLVLRGRPGTGRRTAALRMLMQVGPKAGEVIELDPGTEAVEFADHIQPGGAHVVVDPITSQDSPLRDVHLNAVRRRLGDDGLFVVVAAHGTAMEDVTADGWEPPPAADIARAHLLHAIQHSAADGPSSGAVAADKARRLLELDPTVRYLSASPSPGEAAGFARLLVEYAAGRCDDEELSGYGRTSAEKITSRWFGEGDQLRGTTLRDKAFLISLAVFDGLPYPLVAELGDLLYIRLRTVEEPDRAAGYSVFGSSPADRLALARAQEYDDETDTAWGRLPERVVAFQNESLWSSVLRHVWTSHPAVRKPLLAWFDTLVTDRRGFVRLRAAVASGVLAAADFGSAFDNFLNQWGSSSRPMQRQLAAWALYTAAEHGMDTAVRRLLSNWSRQHNLARRWTATRSYALLGGATATSALRDIGRMAVTGPAPDSALQSALEQAPEALLQGPAAVTVLERLVQWHGSRGPLRDLAAAGFLRGARKRHSATGTAATAWPRLLWLADHDARARRYVVVMWRALLASRSHREAARDELARWVQVAGRASAKASEHRAFTNAAQFEEMERYDTASDVESALGGLLPLLVETQNDWERLDFLLRRLDTPDGARRSTVARLRAGLADSAATLPRPL
ncbi:hypothetical protein [Streptomyces olivaceus]|uniref:hypothetical protein n=1 Tax=Streptomyces olivaceus TaxID=47716 RepID=UPI001885215A|nr:hypothetical protein [Streptomyces olivaceus]